MNDSTDFSGCWISTQWTFPRYQSACVCPQPFSRSWWNAKPFSGNAEPQRWAANHLGHTWYNRETFFADPVASSTAPYPQELNSWSSGISEPIHSSTAEKNENQTPVQDQRCQSGPPKLQSSLVMEILQENYGADPTTTADLRSSFRRILHTSMDCLLEDKIQDWGMVLVHNFLRKLCIGSQKWRMVDSVDDLKSFVINKRYSNAEILKYSMGRMLQHWTESSIILTSDEGSVWRNKKPKKRTVSFAWRQIAYLIYEYFRGHWSPWFLSKNMPTYLQLLFEVMKFRNSIRSGTEFYYSWRKIPSDDVLEGLCKFKNTRESEKLKTVMELYNMEIHQKKAGPDYHRLKTIVTRSIEQDLRALRKNFGGQKRKLWKKRRGQESGDKTAWTKDSRRLLAMENQRAVF